MTRELAHLSDEAVVALLARSDESALAELYDRFGRTAWSLAVRILRDEALAEDAVQDAFLAAWRTAARFLPERGSDTMIALERPVPRSALVAVTIERSGGTDAPTRAPMLIAKA